MWTVVNFREDPKVSNSINSTLPFNQFIVVKKHVFVLEVWLIRDDRPLQNPEVALGPPEMNLDLSPSS